MPDSAGLHQAIEAAACLCGQRDERLTVVQKSEEARLAARLEKRLEGYYGLTGTGRREKGREGIDSETGDCALEALQSIHSAVVEELTAARSSQPASPPLPVLGARDLQTLRILLGIVANWKLSALVSAYDASLAVLQSANASSQAPAKLEEVADEAEVVKRREEEAVHFAAIVAEMGTAVQVMQSLVGINDMRSEVSNAVLHTCAPHIIALSIRLNWGPAVRRGAKDGCAERKLASALLTNLLKTLATSSCLQTLSAVGHVSRMGRRAGQVPPMPSFVKSATERLYSAQLLRADGAMALFKNTFGSEEEHGSGLMKKLVSTGHLLSTPPPNMTADTFAAIIAPRLLDLVGILPQHILSSHSHPSTQSTATQKTAACFALARLHEVAPEAVATAAHSTIWHYLVAPQQDGSSPTTTELHASIELLFHIVEHSEPSTSFLSFLLGPTIIPLFTLLSFLQQSRGPPTIVEAKGKSRAAESELQSRAQSLLITWLRLGDVDEAGRLLQPTNRSGLFAISGSSVGAIKDRAVEQRRPCWDWVDGQVGVVWRESTQPQDLPSALSALSITDLQPMLQTSEDAEALPPALLSALQLAPSPSLLASLLKEARRQDIASELLSVLLEAYTLVKQSRGALLAGEDTSRERVLYVQLIVEVVDKFGSQALSGQADKTLSFINFALGRLAPSEGVKVGDVGQAQGQGALFDLTNVANQTAQGRDVSGEEDNDEDDDDELVQTALNLLLSLLEGDEQMSTSTHSILNPVSAKLDWQASHSTNDEVRALAREARLVLTARQSSRLPSKAEPVTGTGRQQAFARGNEMYQEALRLLQDPILPVRAHGLIMLKDLAACGSTDASRTKLMDPALIPAILDIYLQAIQDDESFLYLNAVKGVAEMAEAGGARMISRIVHLYLGSQHSKAEVDMQLRMGEALLQVVQRLEEALAPHVGIIVEPLLTALRDGSRPTTLRSSYLSILGTCIEACPSVFSLSSLSSTLTDAMLDLLTVESSTRPQERQQAAMEDPTRQDSKLPQLRRAALLLLALLIRGSRHQIEAAEEKRLDKAADDEGHLTSLRLPNGSTIGASRERTAIPSLLFGLDKAARAGGVLGYVAQTDADALVRHQAGQLLDELGLLTASLQAAAGG